MQILSLTIAALLAQVPAGPSPAELQALIEGIVLGPNGPLAGASVSAMWDSPPASYQPGSLPGATTSSDGRFLIQVSPGAYRLTARAAGYVPQTYSSVVRLNPQESLKDLTIALAAEGVLGGRVATTDGQPLVRIQVVALKKKFTALGASLESGGTAETNDRGEYRIAGLTAGTYIISARGLNPLMIPYEEFAASRRPSAAAPVTSSPGAYGPVYYPAADQPSRASTVEIRPGIEATNIDFVLPKRGVYAIRGRVTGAPRAPGISIRPAYVNEASAGSVSSGDAYKPDGTFELAGVPPGLHWVIAQVPVALTPEQRALVSTPGADLSQLPRPSRGASLVHVVDGDIDNVELTMVPGLEVSGQLKVDGERFDFSGRLADFKFELRATDSLGNGAPNNISSLDAGGEFVYRRILPTEYRLTISTLPAPFYVKEARYNNVDALTENLLSASHLYQYC